MQNTKFNLEKPELLGKRFVYLENAPIDESAQKAALEAAKEQEKKDVAGGMTPEQAQQKAMDAITKVESALPDKTKVEGDSASTAEQLRSINAIKDAVDAARHDILAARENLENTAKEVTTCTQVAGEYRLDQDAIGKDKKHGEDLGKLTANDFPLDKPNDVTSLNIVEKDLDNTLTSIDARVANLDAMIKGVEAVKDPLVKERFNDILTDMKIDHAYLTSLSGSLKKVSDDLSLHRGIKAKEAVDNATNARQESGVLQQKLAKAGNNVPPALQAQADQALAQFRAAQAIAKAFEQNTLPAEADTLVPTPEEAGPDFKQVDLSGNEGPGAIPADPNVPRV